jgi:hypothetical protein
MVTKKWNITSIKRGNNLKHNTKRAQHIHVNLKEL